MRLLYVDTSALFKRYVEEDDSDAVLERMEEAPVVGTALITRVEVAAALAQAVRHQRMGRNEAQDAQREFLNEWEDFARIGMTDALAARAGDLAWRHDLRATMPHNSPPRSRGGRRQQTPKTRSYSRVSTTISAGQRGKRASIPGRSDQAARGERTGRPPR